MALNIDPGSNKTSGLCKLVLTGDLTIYGIAELKQDFEALLTDYQYFELDLAGVEEIDSAGIQCLMALKRELQRQQKEFNLLAVSGCVNTLFTSYGLGKRLLEGTGV